MLIEFTGKKILVIVLIVVLLAAALAGFIRLNALHSLVPRAGEHLTMLHSEMAYTFVYKNWSETALPIAHASANARSIPVLLYHGEGSNSNMPTSVFADQMQALQAAGWRTITLAQFDQWERGQLQLPDKSFLLTFDDGRKDTYYQADPVLADTGFTAVMFVITGFSLPASGTLANPNFYLNSDELRSMVASGRWDLESHGDADHAVYAVQSTTNRTQTATTTKGHFLSNKFWNAGAGRFETDAEFAARVESDLVASKLTLERTFGHTVTAFAYPFNDFGQDSVNFPGSQNILDQIVPGIYTYAFYQSWPENGDTFNYPLTNNGPGSRPYMIKRIEPQPSWSGEQLLAVLAAGAAKPLPYHSSSFGIDWVQVWGSVRSSGDGLALSALPDASGADAFLNGTYLWSDYRFSAYVDWRDVSDVALIARNSDDKHFIDCAFSAAQVEVERHDGSNITTLVRQGAALPQADSVELGIGVSGNTVTCYEQGAPVASISASMAAQGGIGIETWQKEPGVARVQVTSVDVSAIASTSVRASAPGLYADRSL